MLLWIIWKKNTQRSIISSTAFPQELSRSEGRSTEKIAIATERYISKEKKSEKYSQTFYLMEYLF